MSNPATDKTFPNAIYADDDLVCGDNPDDRCRVRYVRADLADAVHRALVELSNRVYTGYDFNADPDKITLMVGDAITGIKKLQHQSIFDEFRAQEMECIEELLRGCDKEDQATLINLVRIAFRGGVVAVLGARTPITKHGHGYVGGKSYQEAPPGMKLNTVRMMDGKPVNCYIEDKS